MNWHRKIDKVWETKGRRGAKREAKTKSTKLTHRERRKDRERLKDRERWKKEERWDKRGGRLI